MITIRYEGNVAFTQKLVHQEFSSKIVKVLAEKGQLYLLRKKNENYSLKMFRLTDAGDLEYINTINEIEDQGLQFVNAFRRAKTIASNILVHNDKKCTKIYEGSSTVKPSLQDYYNFWPEPQLSSANDRQMLIT
jgi:hypothetical protein